jgi:GntR family transcriptional regulator/MocR family aminotransferase
LPGVGDCCGHIRLRAELATMLSRSRGLAVGPDNLMVTRSIEQAIDLVARALLAPGDVVAVEEFGYPPAWNVLRLAGANLVPLPLDGDGLAVDALERLLAQQRIRAVFLTPHHQFPTTSVMSPKRRERLAALALQHRFAIIEDDYDHEFHYAGKPVLPIAAGAGGANVVYLGSMANLLAPGISAGFVVAPPPVFEHLRSLRTASDARGDAAMECAIAELFEDGELLRHVRRMRRAYAARRDALAAALKHHLGGALSFRVPEGGMALWARADDGIDLAGWQRAGERENVLFHSAQRYDLLQREQPFMRLAFSYLDEAELTEAARRMARALTRARTTQLAVTAPSPPRSPQRQADVVCDLPQRHVAERRVRSP